MVTPPLSITSEIGKLTSVLLHRPGLELENLIPDYLEELLFDDIPFLPNAQKEHDTFAQVLRDNGAEVLYLDQLTADALADDQVKHEFIADVLAGGRSADDALTATLTMYLLGMDTLDMVRKIIAGVRKDEIHSPADPLYQLHEMAGDPYPFYMDPMPNLYFTRDPAATIGTGLTINRMRFEARRRESLFMKYVVKHHPRFAEHDIPVWYDRDKPFHMEGGDELVLSPEAMAIGISQRTSTQAIEAVAHRLLLESDFKKIIGIEIPSSHTFMHLDTVFTMIDRTKFTIHPEIQSYDARMNIIILSASPDRDSLVIERRDNLTDTLREVLHLEEVELIPCGGGDPIAAAREQWSDGSNTLTIAPGVVVTYDRNYVSNATMRDAGLKVIEVPSAELGRGRGGPRCMSMPLIREDI